MADQKISELSDAGAVQDGDEFPLARAGATLKALWSAMKAAAAFNGGTITEPLTIDPPTTSGAGPAALRIETPELVNDTTDVFVVHSDEAAADMFRIDSGGSVEYLMLAVNSVGWRVEELSPGLQPLVQVTGQDARGGKAIVQYGSDLQEQFLFGNGGLRINNVNAPPADGDLVAGSFSFWLDDTNGATKLMVKAKSADGTVVTGEVALT